MGERDGLDVLDSVVVMVGVVAEERVTAPGRVVEEEERVGMGDTESEGEGEGEGGGEGERVLSARARDPVCEEETEAELVEDTSMLAVGAAGEGEGRLPLEDCLGVAVPAALETVGEGDWEGDRDDEAEGRGERESRADRDGDTDKDPDLEGRGVREGSLGEEEGVPPRALEGEGTREAVGKGVELTVEVWLREAEEDSLERRDCDCVWLMERVVKEVAEGEAAEDNVRMEEAEVEGEEVGEGEGLPGVGVLSGEGDVEGVATRSGEGESRREEEEARLEVGVREAREERVSEGEEDWERLGRVEWEMEGDTEEERDVVALFVIGEGEDVRDPLGEAVGEVEGRRDTERVREIVRVSEKVGVPIAVGVVKGERDALGERESALKVGLICTVGEGVGAPMVREAARRRLGVSLGEPLLEGLGRLDRLEEVDKVRVTVLASV